MKEITPQELKAMKEGNETFQLIDVREAYEAEICSIGGTLIPMGEVISRLAEVRKDVPSKWLSFQRGHSSVDGSLRLYEPDESERWDPWVRKSSGSDVAVRVTMPIR